MRSPSWRRCACARRPRHVSRGPPPRRINHCASNRRGLSLCALLVVSCRFCVTKNMSSNRRITFLVSLPRNEFGAGEPNNRAETSLERRSGSVSDESSVLNSQSTVRENVYVPSRCAQSDDWDKQSIASRRRWEPGFEVSVSYSLRCGFTSFGQTRVDVLDQPCSSNMRVQWQNPIGLSRTIVGNLSGYVEFYNASDYNVFTGLGYCC